jgi:hydroxymethylpyrimidine/phosphomethylpyrimidine kinase
MSPQQKPIVLAVGGLDPANCAGIGADSQVLAALGAHSYALPSSLTVQNPKQALQSKAVSPGLFSAQLRALFMDPATAPQGIKVGLVQDPRHWRLLKRHTPKTTPLVIDPVLNASSGLALAKHNRHWLNGFRKLALQAQLITPNQDEYQQLQAFIPASTPVLVTGAREGETICNELWQHGKRQQRFQCQAQEAEFRGTGCRLSSAITYHLACGASLAQAIEQAMLFVERSIQSSYALGAQNIPDSHAAKGDRH